MTDNRTTETRKKRGWSAKTASMMEGLVDDGQDGQKTELMKLLDERGVHYVHDGHCVTWSYYSDPHTATESMDGTLIVSGCTPEQAIAATLGGGKLTAEQVREAVMSADRWEKPMGNTGLTNTHLIIRDDGWQAIADELNAKLGCEAADADDALSLLDEIREAGRISYDDYSQLFDAIAELGSGTCETEARS